MTNPEDQSPDESEEQAQPPYLIEMARSGRSKCKTCRRAIEKDKLRFGILVEGRFGVGYMWHHLNCAAKQHFDNLEEAYGLECYDPELELPSLSSLKNLAEKAAKKKEDKKEIPYVERAPTGRSKCKHCEETIEKGAWRVILARNVEFYGQVRKGPINVHSTCVRDALQQEDCATEAESFFDDLKSHSSELSDSDFEIIEAEIGPV